MKKFIVIGGVVYIAIGLGSAIWMIADPESYGKLMGKYFKGFYSVLETKEDQTW